MTDGHASRDESSGVRLLLGALRDDSPRGIGPYQVLARLGTDGMDEVFLAADPRAVAQGAEPSADHPGAPAEDAPDAAPVLVAIRVIRTDLGHEPAFRERFGREVVSALPARGRCVARLFAADPVAVHPWLATEYVSGPTLERAVRIGGPLPRAAVLRLGLELAEALRDIHRAGILHRDLSPANVLLGADGPKVTGFGIARDLAADDVATSAASADARTGTRTGARAGAAALSTTGSPGFLTPEHLLGPRHVVAASDVFGLAAVLCHAATGTNPFGDGRSPAEVLRRVARAEVAEAALPPTLRPLIGDCLVANPSARPDPAELEARFRRALAEAPQDKKQGQGQGYGQGHGQRPSAEAPVRWSAAVDAEIRRYETELARVLAATGPLTPPAPTRPGARRAGATCAASASRGPGAAHDPLGPSPVPSPRPRRRTVTAVLAAAVSVGVLGSLGALRLGGDGGDARAGDAKPGSSSPADDPRLGVTTAGYMGSRTFPVDPAARPKGWQPWRTKLAGRPWDCALNSDVLVCRTVSGGLEAVGAADGSPRWKEPAATRDKPERAAGQGSSVPGDASGPVLYGDLVLTYEGGMARGRSVRDGAVRWEQPLPKGTRVGDVVLGERTAFFTIREADATSVHAFDVTSGRPLWQRPLAGHRAAGAGAMGGADETGGADEADETDEAGEAGAAEGGRFGAQAFAQGRVIATAKGGLTGFDARSGDPVRFTTSSGADCLRVRVFGAEVHCGLRKGGLVTLDAKNLRAVDGASPGTTAGGGPGAQELVEAGGAMYRLGPDEDGTRIELQPLGGGEADAEPRTVGTYRPYSPPSEQSIIGKYAVYADDSSLHTLPVGGGPGKKHRVEGAPGERKGAADPTGLGGRTWRPQILSIGGALWLAYDDGTVISLELPS